MRARAALFLTPLLGLAACTGGGSSFAQPKASAFAPGTCHDLAAPVLSLGRDLHGLGSKAPTKDQAEAIKEHQTQVRTISKGLTGDLEPSVQKLVTAVGVLRIRNDTDSYDASLARDAMTAYQDLVRTCTSA